jgi:hypothetical protein
LYLPESWASDRRRCRAAGVPAEAGALRKWEIAEQQLAALQAEGLPPAPPPADAGYGVITAFRDRVTAMGIDSIQNQHVEMNVQAQPVAEALHEGDGPTPQTAARSVL